MICEVFGCGERVGGVESLCEEHARTHDECNHCNEYHHSADGNLIDGSYYCEYCSFECDWCLRNYINEEHLEFDGVIICGCCYDEHTFYCEGCEERYNNNCYGEDNMCDSCSEDNELDSPDTDLEVKTITSKTFKINKSKRYLGIELEVEGGSRRKIKKYFEDKGLPYNWDMVYDGSLNKDGIEMVSPKMNGDAAYLEIDNMCKALLNAGFSVGDTCGMHVHFDFSKYNEKFIKKVALAYAIYESFFSRMLPKSRRSNQYCLPMINHYSGVYSDLSKKLDCALYGTNSKGSLESRKREKYNSLRYGTLNIHSYYLRGSLEVRSHSGTINPLKIKNWIEIHENFFEWALSKSLIFLLKHKANVRTWRDILKEEKLINYYKEREKEFYVQSRKEFVHNLNNKLIKMYSPSISSRQERSLMKLFCTEKEKKKKHIDNMSLEEFYSYLTTVEE